MVVDFTSTILSADIDINFADGFPKWMDFFLKEIMRSWLVRESRPRRTEPVMGTYLHKRRNVHGKRLYRI